jgi:hypothetical protein
VVERAARLSALIDAAVAADAGRHRDDDAGARTTPPIRRIRRDRARPAVRSSGVLLLDKPVGWTSNAALQAVKRLYQAKKAGHTGSLDPLASGLLPLCLGEATKLSGCC